MGPLKQVLVFYFGLGEFFPDFFGFQERLIQEGFDSCIVLFEISRFFKDVFWFTWGLECFLNDGKDFLGVRWAEHPARPQVNSKCFILFIIRRDEKHEGNSPERFM